MVRDNCKHKVWTVVWNSEGEGYVYLANDNDGYYVQQFSNSRELLDFVGELLVAHDDAFATDGKVTRLLTLQTVRPEAQVFLDGDEEDIREVE